MMTSKQEISRLVYGAIVDGGGATLSNRMEDKRMWKNRALEAERKLRGETDGVAGD